ncbi:LOW QUALITY PROTEIN: TATA box-binding protein-like 1 [Amphiura filiformis]|uniref:LOW QUALITY PROTEIN: TATA box-binding protein-like 1 n=1 Tax=Amphiura filiformis TaxID=82378 RepID=UPI003B21797C
MTQVESNPLYPHLHGVVDAAQPTANHPGNGVMNPEQAGLAALGTESSKAAGDDASPSVDIFINNVVCTFSVRCHLNLHRIGMDGHNVEYRREYGKVTMRFRKPSSTATMWSSGKVTMTGNDSAAHAKVNARRCARALQKLGFRVAFSNYKVVNVLGTSAMPWGIRLPNFSREHRRDASYEPELHPAVTYRIKSPKATLKLFSTGSITCTAPSVENVQLAIEHIYPLVLPFKKIMTEEELAMRGNQSKNARRLLQQRAKKAAEEDEVEEGEVNWEEDSEEEIEEDMYSGSDDSDL